jgi:hypothetical protein
MVVWVVITGAVFAIASTSELSLGKCFGPQIVRTRWKRPRRLMIPALAFIRSFGITFFLFQGHLTMIIRIRIRTFEMPLNRSYLTEAD